MMQTPRWYTPFRERASPAVGELWLGDILRWGIAEKTENRSPGVSCFPRFARERYAIALKAQPNDSVTL